MTQEKREKVIKALECCGYSHFMDKCQECPYDGKNCFTRLKADALALLKAQEPVVRCKDCKHWHEDIGSTTAWLMCHEIVTDRNWFCADGERRENE